MFKFLSKVVKNWLIKVIQVLDPRSIIIDLTVSYNGKCDIQLKYKLFSVSIV